jgi:hypothetical protein
MKASAPDTEHVRQQHLYTTPCSFPLDGRIAALISVVDLDGAL